MNLIVLPEEANQRLDIFFLPYLPSSISRSSLQRMIKDGYVKVNDLPVKSSYQVKEKDHIFIEIPERKSLSIEAEDLPLNIVFEDQDIIVVNKEAGMITHPTPNILNKTLVNALLFHSQKLSNLGAPLRPGIVHRLDKDTSGLLVVAKNDSSYLSLFHQIQERRLQKKYQAIVYGKVKEELGRIDLPIGRHPQEGLKMSVMGRNYKEAETTFKVLDRFFLPKFQFSFLEVELKTGRTHQIRVHLSYIKHPLVKDKVYGPKDRLSCPLPFINRQALHAKYLKLLHPRTKKEIEFYAEMPDDMANLLDYLKKESRDK
ncbi:MAG: RluA family pseudouridine synthase [bacterium]